MHHNDEYKQSCSASALEILEQAASIIAVTNCARVLAHFNKRLLIMSCFKHYLLDTNTCFINIKVVRR